MSFRETIRAGIETAFSVGAEFVTVGTYLRKSGTPTYDPITDTTTPGQAPVTGVRFLKTSTDVTEREASPIAITDVKFLVPAVDLPGVTPNEADQVQPGDGITYNIVATRPLPGNDLYIIFGRQA